MRAASQKVSFSTAFQPGMPKTRMVTFQRATEKVRDFSRCLVIPGLSGEEAGDKRLKSGIY
jgi:hypothetical protein